MFVAWAWALVFTTGVLSIVNLVQTSDPSYTRKRKGPTFLTSNSNELSANDFLPDLSTSNMGIQDVLNAVLNR
jgi:hypothetical protein